MSIKKKILTLCLIRKDNQVLLGFKKRGFGANRWNGFGGKVESGETIEEATKREVKEEAEIDLLNLENFGTIEFEFQDSGEMLEVHFFKSTKFSGQPTETEEMKPQWFDLNNIPFEQMWPDDQLWFPLFLADKKFIGKILMADISTIINHDIKEV